MSVRVNVDELVAQVQEIDLTPLNQITFTADQIVSYLDQEMQGTIVPITKKCMEEYFINTMTVPVQAGDTSVTIPSSAAGFALRDIYFYDQNDNFLYKAVRINPDQIEQISGISIFGPGVPGFGFQYYIIENNNIVWWPKIQNTAFVKIRYFRSPNHLMSPIKAGGRVTGKLAGNKLQMDNIPTDWTTFTGVNAITLDVTTPDSPYNFRQYPLSASNTGNVIGLASRPVIDISLIGVSPGFVIEVDTDSYNAIQTGDFVWKSGYCGYVQYLPYEALQLIKLRASMRILKAQGDLQNLNVSAQLFNAAADDYVQLISPKVQNAPRKIKQAANLTMTRRNLFSRF
jgi:hypothetical protein